MNAISITDLARSFGTLKAVDRLNFEVKQGEIFGLVGPDGAGKSTTIRMLATILTPTSGTATVAGYDICCDVDDIRSRIGYMAQRFNLYGDLSIEENLFFFADVFNVKRKARDDKIRDLYRFSGLEPFKDRRAKFLSGGMKQKLALACTLIHEPRVLFLDEPTTGVDPVSRREFWRILSDLHTRGVTLFVSTPYLDEAERCTSVAFMDQGRIQALTTPRELIGRYSGQSFEIRCAKGIEEVCAFLETLPEVLESECFPELIKLTIIKDASINDLIGRFKSKGAQITEIRALRPSMENAYIGLAKSVEESSS